MVRKVIAYSTETLYNGCALKPPLLSVTSPDVDVVFLIVPEMDDIIGSYLQNIKMKFPYTGLHA